MTATTNTAKKKSRERQRSNKKNKKKSTSSHLKACRENSKFELIISILPAHQSKGTAFLSRFSDPKTEKLGDDKAIKRLEDRVIKNNWKGRMYGAKLYYTKGDRSKPIKRYNAVGIVISEEENERLKNSIKRTQPILKLQFKLFPEEINLIRKIRINAFEQNGVTIKYPLNATSSKRDKIDRKALLDLKRSGSLIRPVIEKGFLGINSIFNSQDLNDHGQPCKATALKSLHEIYLKGINHPISIGIVQSGVVYLQQYKNESEKIACVFDEQGRIIWKNQEFKAIIKSIDPTLFHLS